MTTFRNYDPSQVTFTFKGLNVTGYQDGTFIDAERSEDGFTKHVGSLGDVTRVRSMDRSGKVTLTLMAQSPINDLLYAIADADEGTGLNYGPLAIKDLNGTMRCHAHQAWIKKLPKVERAKESGAVVWEFECASLDLKPGGGIY